jgi:hypothetical protein
LVLLTPVVAFSGVWAVGVMIPWIVVKMKITWDKENRPLKDDLLLFRTTSLLGNLASMIFALVGGLICSWWFNMQRVKNNELEKEKSHDTQKPKVDSASFTIDVCCYERT